MRLETVGTFRCPRVLSDGVVLTCAPCAMFQAEMGQQQACEKFEHISTKAKQGRCARRGPVMMGAAVCQTSLCTWAELWGRGDLRVGDGAVRQSMF